MSRIFVKLIATKLVKGDAMESETVQMLERVKQESANCLVQIKADLALLDFLRSEERRLQAVLDRGHTAPRPKADLYRAAAEQDDIPSHLA